MTIQLIGSLVAILILAGIAWALKLGPPPQIDSEARARALAREADSGFDPECVAIGRDGGSAILSDRGGRIMVLRGHGTHFAGRILEAGAAARIENGVLTVTPTDARFGTVTLDLRDAAQTWESRIESLGKRHDV